MNHGEILVCELSLGESWQAELARVGYQIAVEHSSAAGDSAVYSVRVHSSVVKVETFVWQSRGVTPFTGKAAVVVYPASSWSGAQYKANRLLAAQVSVTLQSLGMRPAEKPTRDHGGQD
jgi:hypothetical protein